MANQSSSKSYNIETILAHTATLSAKQRAFQAQYKDTLYEDVAILFCKICNCVVDHSRQSCFDHHKKTEKHQDNKKVPQKKQKTKNKMRSKMLPILAHMHAAYFQKIFAYLLQACFSRITIWKLASCLTRYLRCGDHIRSVVEKTKCEYKVIVSVMKWSLFSNLIAWVENAV